MLAQADGSHYWMSNVLNLLRSVRPSLKGPLVIILSTVLRIGLFLGYVDMLVVICDQRELYNTLTNIFQVLI